MRAPVPRPRIRTPVAARLGQFRPQAGDARAQASATARSAQAEPRPWHGVRRVAGRPDTGSGTPRACGPGRKPRTSVVMSASGRRTARAVGPFAADPQQRRDGCLRRRGRAAGGDGTGHDRLVAAFVKPPRGPHSGTPKSQERRYMTPSNPAREPAPSLRRRQAVERGRR
jgi:hypothetical protein